MSLLELPKALEETKTTIPATPSSAGSCSQRVEAEQNSCIIQAFSLEGEIPQTAPDAWKETIGIFDGDAVFKAISEAGKSIRDSQRDI